jgi:hypothetical protein
MQERLKVKIQGEPCLGKMVCSVTIASPFGACLRPVDPQDTEPPFTAWKYRPAYLADPLLMHIGEAGIEESLWVSFMRRVHHEQGFIEHRIGIREITGLTLITPVPLRSNASQK